MTFMSPVKTKSIPAPLLKSLMSAVVDSAMDAIISVDENQTVILFNAAAEQMFQCSRGEALGQKLDRFIPERHLTNLRLHVEDFGNSGKTTRAMGRPGTLSALRADGVEFPVEISVSTVQAGGKQFFTAILRDVTERFRAEELHSRLAGIVESSNDAIIGKNLDGMVTSWNHGAEMIF